MNSSGKWTARQGCCRCGSSARGCCHWEGHSPFPLSARQLGPIETPASAHCVAWTARECLDSTHDATWPVLGARPLLVLKTTSLPVQQTLLPTWPLTFFLTRLGPNLPRVSFCHSSSSRGVTRPDQIRFNSTEPNMRANPGWASPCWMSTLNNGRPARVESASESVSSATLGHRTSPPTPRSRGPRSLRKQTLLV